MTFTNLRSNNMQLTCVPYIRSSKHASKCCFRHRFSRICCVSLRLISFLRNLATRQGAALLHDRSQSLSNFPSSSLCIVSITHITASTEQSFSASRRARMKSTSKSNAQPSDFLYILRCILIISHICAQHWFAEFLQSFHDFSRCIFKSCVSVFAFANFSFRVNLADNLQSKCETMRSKHLQKQCHSSMTTFSTPHRMSDLFASMNCICADM